MESNEEGGSVLRSGGSKVKRGVSRSPRPWRRWRMDWFPDAGTLPLLPEQTHLDSLGIVLLPQEFSHTMVGRLWHLFSSLF